MGLVRQPAETETGDVATALIGKVTPVTFDGKVVWTSLKVCFTDAEGWAT